MDDLIVWPSKKVIDLITVEVDLFDQLPVGVTIVSVVASSLVFQGYNDIAAASMLWLVPVIHNSLIQQKVRNGIPGNVYNIRFDITLSDGQEWIKTFRLAITPNNTPAVPVTIPVFFTSRPYPYNYLETFLTGNGIISGHFVPAPTPFEYILPDLSMVGGSLGGGLLVYNYLYEDLAGNLDMLFGNLVAGGLQTYNYSYEDLTGNNSMRSGIITVIVVNYPYSYEDLMGSISMRSGTLV